MSVQSYERGRFYVGPNGFPRFAGSASGVYLADTVQTEVSPSIHTISSTIGEAFISRNSNDEPRPDEIPFYDQFTLKSIDLKDEEGIRERITTYFSRWHPLFPFLDGAYLIQCLDNAIAIGQLEEMIAAGQVDGNRSAFDGLKAEEALVLSAIFMSIISIGDFGLPRETGSRIPRIRTTTQATMLAHLIVGASQNSRLNDLFAIQGLLAIQLYLYSTRTLRPAMHLSGTVSKLAYEAGLHRCPERFVSTFTDPADRQLRKRVFYTLYVLDRLLTAEFGIPIMLHDTDIDTCLPGGPEKHSSNDTPPEHPARTPEINKKRRRPSTEGTSMSTSSPVVQKKPETTADDAAQRRLLAACSLANVVKLTGRAMETFNKSLLHRSMNDQETMHLRVDLDSWWNEIGLECDDEDVPQDDPRRRYRSFFICIYHQQIIHLCRPALSLSPTHLQHAHALQTAISSARVICQTLSRDMEMDKDAMARCWPGYVDMVFFAALILVYGAKKEPEGLSNPRSKTDLKRALRILERLSTQWSNLQAFCKVLQALLDPKPQGEPAAVANTVPVIENDMLNPNFVFNFDTFELNPESTWAYHMSIPGSPIFPT